jgi:hypothetical protein
VDELFARIGSMTPAGAATVAVFVRVPIAPGAIVPVRTKVALPPTSRATGSSTPPFPDGGHVEPADAVQVQLTVIRTGGGGSVTIAPVTGSGPAFPTTIE